MNTSFFGRLLTAASLTGAAFLVHAEITVDDRLPAGNIVFEKIVGDEVFVHQDLRDTTTPWFYWAMRVKGAAGRTLTFRFTTSDAVGVRGPVVSTDGGKTFAYAAEKDATRKSFVYTFGPEEDETYFYECHPYVRTDWDTFVAKYAGNPSFKVGELCKSSQKGASVPVASVGCLNGTPKHRILLSARHHCSETMASWVLEGTIDQFLAGDELGAWLRANVELTVVPFTDYDGVQAGDQGKNRAPHDHNRDYTEFRFAETRAIAELLKRKPYEIYIDVHCPWLHSDCNEFLYTPWKDPKTIHDLALEKRFSQLLEELQCGSMRYRAGDDIPFGVAWNTDKNYALGMSAVRWALANIPSLKICRTYEVPFANARGAVVTPDTCRDLGRDTAKVFKAILSE